MVRKAGVPANVRRVAMKTQNEIRLAISNAVCMCAGEELGTADYSKWLGVARALNWVLEDDFDNPLSGFLESVTLSQEEREQ